MDALTQLEQACAHGCVLLSQSFAFALRPDASASQHRLSVSQRFSGADVATLPVTDNGAEGTDASDLALPSPSANTVHVRRLGVPRRAPSFYPTSPQPGTVSGAHMTESASKAGAFDLLPAGDLDLLGASLLF